MTGCQSAISWVASPRGLHGVPQEQKGTHWGRQANKVKTLLPAFNLWMTRGRFL